jgi:hypothetical protein
MSFALIPSRSNGQTIDATWYNLIKTAGTALENFFSAFKTDLTFSLSVHGYYGPQGTKTGILYMTVPQDIELLTCNLKLYTVGSSGNTEIDIYSKRGAGSWTSVFNTKPKIPYTAGDLSDSDTGTGATAAALNSTKTLLEAGDFLRLDFSATQGGDPKGLSVELGYQVTGAQ